MKTKGLLTIVFGTLLAGCVTDPPGTEQGLGKTRSFNGPVEANQPGTKIEVNYKPLGVAPLTVKIFGDRDGTFHNFGSDEFIIRAYPSNTTQFPQTKIFKTGAMGVPDDRIPQRIIFEIDAA